MKKTRFAFAGFRHGHIMSLYRQVAAHPDCEIVAAAEENAAARKQLAESGQVRITHDDIAAMLKEVPCDAVAIGDCYGRRGAIAIAALELGKHVIADKPLCTSLDELETIRRLAAEKRLSVGCMYTLRDSTAIAGVRRLIGSGKLGEIVQIQFTAQHPLLPGTRPGWYFEKGMHGGTINDIGCHAFDIIPYLAGSPIKRVVAARAWQALPGDSGFQDAGQFMLELENGCGVIADVSYSALVKSGYTHPAYWRFDLWGTKGMVEFHFNSTQLRVYLPDAEGETLIDVPETPDEGYFAGFLREIAGEPSTVTTATTLEAALWSLRTQAMADRN